MKTKLLRQIISVLTGFLLLNCTIPIFADDTVVDFVFSRNVLTYKRTTGSNAASQIPLATPSGVAEPGKVTGYSITFSRTHSGLGEKLKKADVATAAPSLAGTYTANITFEPKAKYSFNNGTKTKEYPSALTIRRAEQSPPILRSSSPALTDNSEKTGGTIKQGATGILSTAWASALKPIYTWSAGSSAVVTPEKGKPARFIAKAPGTAVLSVVLPEDNNYTQSIVARYTVTVTGDVVVSDLFTIKGESRRNNGWYTSDVTIEGKNGFTQVLPIEGGNPITDDGELTVVFALQNEAGDKTENFSVAIKKDSSAPTIDNIRVNDSPWIEAPEDDTAAWAGDADIEVKIDVFDTASGISKLEYRVDSGDYVNVAENSFNQEGLKSYELSHTMENTGHTMWIKATDHAGNIAIRDFVLPKGELTSQPPTQSQLPEPSASPIPDIAPEQAISEPTKAMADVNERLAYLKRCDIDSAVRGDIRANENYVQKTLDMFTQLSAPEREALGDETLLSLRAYFEMLCEVQGKDKALLAPLFVFEPTPSPTPTPTKAPEPTASPTASVPQSERLPSSQSEDVSKAQSKPLSSAGIKPSFSPLYLIPLAVCGAALIVYFMWSKKLFKKKSDFTVPKATQAKSEESDMFGGFNDMNE